MNVYDDVIDPTVVSHSVCGHFTTTDYLELIVIRTDVLSIYKPIRSGRLYLMEEHKLSGRINDVALIPKHSNGSNGNGINLSYLLLSTGVAKLSLLMYNNMTSSIETISLHFYEDKFESATMLDLARNSQLRIEPNGNYAMLFNNDVLAILPFCTGINEDEDEDYINNDKSKINDNSKKSLFKRKKGKTQNNKVTHPSIIINCSELGPQIKNIKDIQFLCGFTKPTIGVLYQPQLAWCGNSQLVPLPTNYAIISLDMKFSIDATTFDKAIISEISQLPSDWHTIAPTLSGSLILGVNEIAFLDNTGVLQSILTLNSYSDKVLPKVRVIDKSSHEVFFNTGSKFALIPSNENERSVENILLFDENGCIFNVDLKSEGRLLTQFNITKLPLGEDVLSQKSNPSSVSIIWADGRLDTYTIFIGFQSGDATMLKLNHLHSAIEVEEPTFMKDYVNKQASAAYNNEDDDDDDDDFNLYSDEENDQVNNKNDRTFGTNESNEPFTAQELMELRNIGPINSMCVGKVSSIEDNVKGLPNPNKQEISIVCTSGYGDGSHLNAILASVQPRVEKALKFISITKIWNLHIKGKDKFLITTDSTQSQSNIYEIDNNFSQHKQGRLRRDATTIHIATIGDNKRIVQVTTNHLYLYDLTFRRFSTIKFDYEVVHVSVMDPYVLITLSRGDIKVFELENRNKKKFVKVPLPEILTEMVITSGLILKSNMCNEFLSGIGKSTIEQLLFTFVTADNQIIFFTKDHNDRIFQLNGIDQLQDSLYISTYQLPDEIIPDPSIKQIMINKLGNNSKDEYLTILTFGGEIYQYKKSRSRHSRFYRNVGRNDHPITGAPDNAYPKGVSGIERIMHYIPNFDGYSVIFVTGNTPYIIMKEDDSLPRIFPFGNIPIVSMSRWGEGSVICIDDIKNARIYSLNQDNIYYGNKLPIRKIKIGSMLQNYKTLNSIVYHERTQLYLVSYTKEISYEAKAEDGSLLIGYKPELPNAKAFKSGVLLINPKSWEVIDELDLPDNSLVNDMKSSFIQIDTRTKRKREYIIVGIGYATMEDVPPTGEFHIYDITEVVPEPGKPNTNFKLKEIFKEDIRGIVSVVNGISGRFLISQSQKIMVRDVQQDNSVIPVAFLDVPVFVTSLKTFGNLIVIGDAMQGIQFVGFDAEPYRMITLGSSITKFEVISVEFLVNNGDIYFLVTDRDSIMHVLKYAPDQPNTLSGQRLVHCSSFNLHSLNNCTMLLPKNDEFPRDQRYSRSFQTITAQVDGSISKIVPVKEETYRRLYFIQQQIIDKEPQLAGLNPRMERQDNKYYHLGHSLRPMLDFNIIKRFKDMSMNRRSHIVQKLGKNSNLEVWRDLIDLEFSLRSLKPTDQN